MSKDTAFNALCELAYDLRQECEYEGWTFGEVTRLANAWNDAHNDEISISEEENGICIEDEMIYCGWFKFE
jgi:hypothetical protein